MSTALRVLRRSLATHWYWSLVALAFFGLALMEHAGRLDVMLTHRSDQLGYYQFLPGFFIQHDLRGMDWIHVLEDGSRLSLFSIGVALLQLPFFLLGHLLALFTGAATTGYTWPYAISQLLGSAVYGSGGLALLASVMRRDHTPLALIIALSVLLLGTNLLYYIVREPGMSHVYSFFLLAWLWRMTFRGAGVRWFLWLSVCGTLIVLVRPLNVVALLLPLMMRFSTFVALFRSAGARPFIFSAAVVAALLAPQLLYWHLITGRWVLFTYGAKGEGFDWSAPHLLDVLVSHQNGWLIYSPLMLVPMGVLVWRGLQGTREALGVLVVWALLWYGYASWWAWWLGAAYGFRGFVEVSAWFAPAMAFFVDRARPLPRAFRAAALLITVFFVLISQRMTWLYTCCWDGEDWTWARLIAVWREALWLN